MNRETAELPSISANKLQKLKINRIIRRLIRKERRKRKGSKKKLNHLGSKPVQERRKFWSDESKDSIFIESYGSRTDWGPKTSRTQKPKPGGESVQSSGNGQSKWGRGSKGHLLEKRNGFVDIRLRKTDAIERRGVGGRCTTRHFTPSFFRQIGPALVLLTSALPSPPLRPQPLQYIVTGGSITVSDTHPHKMSPEKSPQHYCSTKDNNINNRVEVISLLLCLFPQKKITRQ